MIRTLVLLACPLLLAGCRQGPAAAPAPAGSAGRGHLTAGTLAITNVTVIPMTGDTMLRDATVLVRDGRIVEVGPARSVRVPGRATVVDGRGKFLIPGLADMHTHLFADFANEPDSTAAAELGVMLANGVTTARLMIGTPQHLGLRDDVAAGRVAGPQLWMAGPQLAGERDDNAIVVTTAAEARAAVRATKDAGFDFVKLTNGITPEVYDAVIDEARLADIRVVGHVDPRVGVERALRAGEQLEHLDSYLEDVLADSAPSRASVTQAGLFQPRNWVSLDYVDDAKVARLARLTAESGAFVGPTMNIFNTAFAIYESDSLIRSRPDWRMWPYGRRDGYLRARVRYWSANNRRLMTPARQARYVAVRNQLVREIAAAGGKILAGSDTPEWFNTYGWGLHRELAALVTAGLTPYDALAAATRTPAEYLRARGDFGTIERGARADLVLLAANPLEDITNTMRIEGVAAGGRWLPRAQLDAMIERGRVAIAGGRAETSADISAADLRARLSIIADDSMQGRDTGRRGGARAAAYLAAEMRRMGLEPAGDNGTFVQAVPWMRRTPDTTATLRAGAQALRWGTDFLLLPRLGFALALGGQPFGGGFNGTDVASVYGGRIGGTLIAPADAAGKVVVFDNAAGAPFGFWQRDNLSRYAGARAILVATLDLGAPATFRQPRETYWDSTAQGAAQPLTVMAVSARAVDAIFGPATGERRVGQAGQPVSGRVQFINQPTESPSYNVVAILRGSDPALRNTYVAVGAHYDHVGMGPVVDHDSIRAFNTVARVRGADDPQPRAVTAEQWTRINALIAEARRGRPMRPDSIFNGADDDGSGTALALEIAEAFAAPAVPPRRSLLFVFHTAEEKGLFGAQYYTDHPTVPRDSIVGMINMDQMGRGEMSDAPPGGENALVVIGSRRLSSELGDLAETVNRRGGHPFVLDYAFDRDGDPTNAYCRSDHYMYARYGIPVAFFSAAAWHIDYHMVTDEPQYIAYDRSANIGAYIRDFVRAVAGLDQRPRIDKPRPDPDALCRQ